MTCPRGLINRFWTLTYERHHDRYVVYMTPTLINYSIFKRYKFTSHRHPPCSHQLSFHHSHISSQTKHVILAPTLTRSQYTKHYALHRPDYLPPLVRNQHDPRVCKLERYPTFTFNPNFIQHVYIWSFILFFSIYNVIILGSVTGFPQYWKRQ